MFSGQYHVRKDSRSSGKFAHVSMTGAKKADQHKYKKHPYEIHSRQIGLTVKRTVYSVTIHGEQGERLNFIGDIPSAVAAKKAAETWIDQAIRRRPKYARSPLYKHLAPDVQAVEEVRMKLASEVEQPKESGRS